MSAPFVPALDTFQGGQMTDLPAFTATSFLGDELFEIVSGNPLATNANTAVNYSITTKLLGQLLTGLISGQVVIGQGQNMTALTPYTVPVGVGRIYVNKATPEPTYITFGAASAGIADVLVKDVAGTSDNAGNGIFLTVTADGVTNPTITSPYGGFWLRPVVSLNIWTLGTA
jgi:hypothetical protein